MCCVADCFELLIIFIYDHTNMKIRGLGSSNKCRELSNLVHCFKSDFLIVCETKADSFSQPLLRSIEGCRLTCWEFLPSQGAAGGILISWDASVASKLEVNYGNYSLSIKFRNYSNSFEWWLTRGLWAMLLSSQNYVSRGSQIFIILSR